MGGAESKEEYSSSDEEDEGESVSSVLLSLKAAKERGELSEEDYQRGE